MFGVDIFIMGLFVIIIAVFVLTAFFHHEQGGGQASDMLTLFGVVFAIATAIWALICFVW